MDQGLLAVAVLPGGKGGEHDRSMGVIGSRDDHRVELVAVTIEGLSVVLAGEGVGMAGARLVEGLAVDVAETDDLDRGMHGHLLAIGATDRPHDADAEDVDPAVGGDPCQAWRCEGGGSQAGDSGGMLDEIASVEWGRHLWDLHVRVRGSKSVP